MDSDRWREAWMVEEREQTRETEAGMEEEGRGREEDERLEGGWQ